MAVRFQNLDVASGFRLLEGEQRVRLTEVLGAPDAADRIASYACDYDIGGARITYNYAAKTVSPQILARFQSLADEQQLVEKYRMILSGQIMNPGEGRMVLHHLLRGELAGTVEHEGRDLRAFYEEQRERFSAFAAEVLAGRVTATNGKPFASVVQIGIGGSDLGPRALFLALAGHEYQYAGRKRRGPMLETRFISNVDPDDAVSAFAGLDPATTLFVLVSKSGTTQETLTNEAFALKWLADSGVASPRRQVVAVTSETSPLARSSDYLDSFFIDDFIGGRYSSSSAVGGAILSLAYGPDVFAEVLAGAHAADRAALESTVTANPAMLDALIGVYERNVLGYPATAVLPYSQALIRFPAHLQQLDMESNGKRVNRDGQPLDYSTGPIIFGEPGTNGQHSFYQLLHQGTDIVPLQFIGFRDSQYGTDLDFDGSTSQRKLLANLVAQIVAFALGKDDPNPNKHFAGERPSSLLWSDRLTPRTLGAILGHFENKVMFQGLLWNVNSFDQEGVQLGKKLAGQVLGGGDLDPALAAFRDLTL
ncbi:MAG: glucose-6-phosphate isomerase [Spirochaetota bacterium]